MTGLIALPTPSAVGVTIAPDGERSFSLSTADVAWTERALTVDDLPDAFRKVAPDAGVLAEAVVALHGAARKTESTFEQRRDAFRAYEDRIVVARITRPLSAVQGKSFLSPAGPWSVAATRLVVATGTRAVRKTGTVSPGRLVAPPTGAGTGRAPKREHAAAIEAEAYLPMVVRSGLQSAVPKPVGHTGSLLLWTTPAGRRQRVEVMRSDTRTAVVVRAERPDRPDADWSVVQWTYQLRGTAHEIERGSRP
ncbi:hypothetical protein Sked_28930 [Sanguibacter keddieii DSM 10542]|uniref:Uncharacterized protein n=1 Tax=Sanguibacter keddieii (strain ATCC 51767 / DSM 10542 / NCFB 3025 / ST-74) TaxID=446469 RepID=D1BBM4_SANKS|nr:hypothetical protein [Sanguibacter keddieii]ACZ22795.1 hypothetical protein Sked_28930 [Sanguibacter keddieii DSM 10542]